MMTELGMETEVNPVQLWKVPSAISVIELGWIRISGFGKRGKPVDQWK